MAAKKKVTKRAAKKKTAKRSVKKSAGEIPAQPKKKKDVTAEYAVVHHLYSSFTDRVHSLLDELFKRADIKVHLIESRAKSVDSLVEKLTRPGKSYGGNLNDIPDLAGVRVIVYYQDDVERIQEQVEKEFRILETETSHQPNEYSPDQFGYLSLHILAAISSERANLPEWEDYTNLQVELQVRTVLQHSWAAISHALQYKRESDVPSGLRRKLFRLAGLFELADEQFIDLRDDRSELQKSVKIAFKEDREADLPIDRASLIEFIQNWDKLTDIKEFMEARGYDFDEEFANSHEFDNLGPITEFCQILSVKTIRDLRDTLNFNPKKFLARIVDHETGWNVSDGFVLYLLLIRARVDDFTTSDLTERGWDASIARRVLLGARNDKLGK